jgi:TrpR-related protein YerC/YecD
MKRFTNNFGVCIIKLTYGNEVVAMDCITKKHLTTISKIFTAFDKDKDMKDLLLDVCTVKELEAIYQRLRVAQMLRLGLSFNQIETKTGISSTTITRVSKALKNGKGYNKAFDKYNLSINVDV